MHRVFEFAIKQEPLKSQISGEGMTAIAVQMGAENLTVWEPIPMKLKRIHAKYNSNKALEQNDYSALLKADLFDSFEK